MSDEAHFSAEQPRPQASSRIPRPHGNRSRPQEAQRLTTIRKRADFLAANGGRRASTPGFILLVRGRQDQDPSLRVGFTGPRKSGGAVVRNRMKRRFRELARELVPVKGLAGADHVLI